MGVAAGRLGAGVQRVGTESATTQTRDTQWFGMILFLVSEAIMFGSIFAQYFYGRLQAAQWPPDGHFRVDWLWPALPLTIILALSGLTAHNAQTAIRRNNQDATRAWLALTILLGLAFLAGQAFEYYTLIVVDQLVPSTGIYATTFFTLTGLHGLHVTAGVVVLIGVLWRTILGHFSARNHFGLEGSVLYWHFVDIVWFFLYAVVYLI